LRKKVGIEEFLNVEKLVLEKANATNVVSIRSSLDSLKYSYE